MFAIDTNLLLYAVNRDAPVYEHANQLLDAWRDGAEDWFTTWSVVYEFLRVSTHRRAFKQPLALAAAWSFVDGLLASPRFGILVETERHAEIVGELAAEYPDLSGNIRHDLHTVGLMREHGVTEIRTADNDFRRFKHLRVVNPLVP